MKRAAIIGAGAVLAAAALLAVWGLGAFSRSKATAEPMRFAVAGHRRIAATVLATGIVRLRTGAEVRVGSQVSGIVQKLNVTVGSRIRKGDVIAEIDSRGLRARLAQAQAQIAVNEQELRRAKVELARVQRLVDARLVPMKEVENDALAVDDAAAKLEKARRDADVVATDLAYTVIRAPIAGTVASVSTQEGETVAASFTAPTFVTIIGDRALQLIAMVDETDIGAVTPGNAVGFTVESYPAEEFAGKVESIAPKGSIISGVVNYEVLIRIDSPLELLKPDMTANVSIRTAEREALVVPNEAVQRDGVDRFVYVQSGTGVIRRPVQVGTREAGFIEIRRGVAADERILIGPMPAGGNPAAAESGKT